MTNKEVQHNYIVLVPLVSRGHEAPLPGFLGEATPDTNPDHDRDECRGAYLFYKKLDGVTLKEAKEELSKAEDLAEKRLRYSSRMKSYAVALHNTSTDTSIGDGYLFDRENASNALLRDKYEISVGD
jgi:hypothetical protein